MTSSKRNALPALVGIEEIATTVGRRAALRPAVSTEDLRVPRAEERP